MVDTTMCPQRGKIQTNRDDIQKMLSVVVWQHPAVID